MVRFSAPKLAPEGDQQIFGPSSGRRFPTHFPASSSDSRFRARGVNLKHGDSAKRAYGRAAVIATGTFGASPDKEIASIKQIADVDTEAACILANHLGSPGDPEAQWSGDLKRIVDGTGDIPLGFYECPTPCKRLAPTTVYEWAAKTGRFVFHKDVIERAPAPMHRNARQGLAERR